MAFVVVVKRKKPLFSNQQRHSLPPGPRVHHQHPVVRDRQRQHVRVDVQRRPQAARVLLAEHEQPGPVAVDGVLVRVQRALDGVGLAARVARVAPLVGLGAARVERAPVLGVEPRRR